MQKIVVEGLKAMTRNEIIRKAMRGLLNWFQAADILEISARKLRRIALAASS